MDEQKRCFLVGDRVLLLCNHTLGHIERIHNWQPLHNVRGEDGCMYGNQYKSEITLVRTANVITT